MYGMLVGMRSLKTLAASATIAAGLIAVAPSAGADAVDDMLAKLPSGQISCSQASKYWTNESDYNNKVAQARTLAMFDSRGPQILNALSRVEEAANRCGLKGGTASTGTTGTTGTTQNTGTNAGTTAAPVASGNGGGAAATGNGVVQAFGPSFSIPLPAGTPTFTVNVPGVGSFTLPDLVRIVTNFLNQAFGQAGSSI